MIDHSPQVIELTERVEQLERALSDLIDVAEQCDGWENFPSSALDDAHNSLK